MISLIYKYFKTQNGHHIQLIYEETCAGGSNLRAHVSRTERITLPSAVLSQSPRSKNISAKARHVVSL